MHSEQVPSSSFEQLLELVQLEHLALPCAWAPESNSNVADISAVWNAFNEQTNAFRTSENVARISNVATSRTSAETEVDFFSDLKDDNEELLVEIAKGLQYMYLADACYTHNFDL